MLPALDAPEIFFGLCSPVGTNNQKVADLIKELLLPFGYATDSFKVTDLMEQVEIPGFELMSKPVDKRYHSHILYANELRDLLGYPSALAMMCCGAVRAFRRAKTSDPSAYIQSQAYIFDQFKRKEEIEALRQVYGRLFIVVSIYSDKTSRTKRLSEKIGADHASSRPSMQHENTARELVLRDEEEEGVPSGQRLRDAFPLADVFLNIDDLPNARATLDRFLKLFFGANNLSPTKDEYGLYIAKSAALRSLDLSRQVGAAIFSDDGEVIALGSNEVPKSGGGTYWTEDSHDARDHVIAQDENDRIKKSLLADVVRRVMEAEVFQTNRSPEDIVANVLGAAATKGTPIRESQLMDLLEFGRIIHAEMSALSDAARLGKSTKHAKLYCTTFPCHMCAKHIVAAGISSVTYIEPYPKSYAEQLHSDAIVLGAGENKERKTQFRPFIGISPFRFRELFERGRRKNNDGSFSEWAEGKPKPIVRHTIAGWLANEAALFKIFEEKLQILVRSGRVNVRNGPAEDQAP